jgi:hypothetical protein
VSAAAFLRLFEFDLSHGVGLSFRVYKKTKEFYRVEQRTARGWQEIWQEQQIARLVLTECMFVVDEAGRAATVNAIGGKSTASEAVPVHAWIECTACHGPDAAFQPSGILYFNPFTVRCFMDRASYEAGKPQPLQGARQVRINGNFLEYQGGIFFNHPNAMLPKQESVQAPELIWG